MAGTAPIIVAHRGLHHKRTENSLGAFLAAANAGIPWIECDVWPSSDDIAMIIHDQTLDRTTGGSGEVGQHDYLQLKQLGVSSLREVIDYLAAIHDGKPPSLMVEIKPNHARFVKLVLRELWRCPLEFMIQSFHAENLYAALAIEPGISASFLVETAVELDAAVETGWSSIHADHPAIDRSIVKRMHDSGRKIGAWTVNERDDIQRMIDLGVDMLITDEPELAMEISRASVAPKGHMQE